MSLTSSEQDHAESLLASAQFGDAAQSASAQADLDAWSRQSAERQAYVQRLKAADRALDNYLPDLKLRYAGYAAPAPRPKPPLRAVRASQPFWKFMLPAGAMALAVWAVNPTLSEQQFSTAIGQQRTVELADGSELVLNTNTAGRFVNRLRSREWTQERGEALFTVTHSRWRPFHVAVGSTDIRDLGTRFNVRRLEAGVSVAVLEGSVEVSQAGDAAPVLLQANEGLRIDGQAATRLDTRSVEASVSWRNQRLDFNGTRLADVIHELQRYREKPIVLADAPAGEARITGGFSSAMPDQLLDTLPLVAPVLVSRRPDGTVLISSR